MTKLKNIVANAMNTNVKIVKKAEVEKVKSFLSNKVLSIDPELLFKVSSIPNVNKYELDFNVSDDSYITYGLELVNNGIDQFEIEGKVYDAKISGIVNYYNEKTDSQEEIEVKIPLNLDNVKIDIYIDNNSVELSSINIEEDGGLNITFMSVR